MGEMNAIKHGDKVRVTLEGTALGPCENAVRVAFAGREDGQLLPTAFEGNLIEAHEDYFVSIEKVEPPAEVFGPGDTIRYKGDPELIYSLGENGYFSHKRRVWTPTGTYDLFTSKRYEKIDLG